MRLPKLERLKRAVSYYLGDYQVAVSFRGDVDITEAEVDEIDRSMQEAYKIMSRIYDSRRS